MKRKLRIDELTVTSFSTQEGRRERGTVRGHGDVSFGTCWGEPTCDDTCAGLQTCDNLRTCACESDATCGGSFTCYASCPDRETMCNQNTCPEPCRR